MADPITMVGLGGIAAYLGKDSLQKLLGPTAEYLGEGLKDLTQKRIESIGRILNNAESKLGNRINEKGEVPPRVLSTILNEGSYSNETLSVEYFGGILASSRTENGRDDRGVRVSKTLDGLSTYQLRAHYLIYSTIRSLFSKHNLLFGLEGRPKMQIYIPAESYISAMDFNSEEQEQSQELTAHIFWGLQNEGLIGDFFQFGGLELMKKHFAGATGQGIICGPSTLGAEFFLWGFGQRGRSNEYIFDPSFSPVIEGVPSEIAGVMATKK